MAELFIRAYSCQFVGLLGKGKFAHDCYELTQIRDSRQQIDKLMTEKLGELRNHETREKHEKTTD
jgi:hypothetical protein